MIQQNDLVALVELLNRAPKSPAEALWAQGFIQELESDLQSGTSNNENEEVKHDDKNNG